MLFFSYQNAYWFLRIAATGGAAFQYTIDGKSFYSEYVLSSKPYPISEVVKADKLEPFLDPNIYSARYIY
jgi:hypothetical protein